MDGQCQRRFRRERLTIIYGIWKTQEQRHLEKYNKGLIVSKLMEEKKEEDICDTIHGKVPSLSSQFRQKSA